MKAETFYLLTSKWDGCRTNDLLDKEINPSPWHCKHCGFAFDDVKQVDALTDEDVYLSKQKPLTFIRGSVNKMFLWYQRLIWEEFIEPIPQHILNRDTYFGNIFRQDKTRIEGWRTYRCRYNLFLRGTKNISVTICKDCGFVRYWAAGKLFVYPSPPEDADIFECSGLLLRESIYNLLDMEKWKKKVYVQKVVATSKPLDGLELPQFEIPRDIKWVEEHQDLERS